MLLRKCSSVITVIPREPIAFVFDRYLPLNNSNPKRDPFLPRWELSGPEILGCMERYRPTLSNRDQIWHEHTLTKETCLQNSSPIGLPMGELWALKCPMGPNFVKVCWLRPNGLADLVHFWQVPTLDDSNSHPKGDTFHTGRGVMGPRNLGFYGKV